MSTVKERRELEPGMHRPSYRPPARHRRERRRLFRLSPALKGWLIVLMVMSGVTFGYLQILQAANRTDAKHAPSFVTPTVATAMPVPLVSTATAMPTTSPTSMGSTNSGKPTPLKATPSPAKGKRMQVTVPWRNVRRVPTTVGNKPLRHLGVGDIITVVKAVKGQDVYRDGRRTWWQLTDGTYVWSVGLKDAPATAGKPVTKPAPKSYKRPLIQPARPHYVRPAKGRLTSTFSYRCMRGRGCRAHKGIDIANRVGTPIYAVADGTVISAGFVDPHGYGAWVRIRHKDGTITLYGHVHSWLVHVGQRVHAGQKIATIGQRGNSTGPHLHFEVRVHGYRAINPRPWLAKRGIHV